MPHQAGVVCLAACRRFSFLVEGRDELRGELKDWLRELIGEPQREYTRFEAALGESAVLPPDELAGLLQQRLDALDAAIAQHETGLKELVTQIPRLFLIESEYHLALRRAEAEWIRKLLTEFTDGSFPGIREWQHFHDTGVPPADIIALDEKNRKEAAGG